jgi:3-deoxy-D-manno-octulosonic acid (KDO) 8-phosphate synthase
METRMKTVQVGQASFSNNRPMVLIGGVNVLESRDLAMTVAEAMKTETGRLGMPFVFKGPIADPAWTRACASSRRFAARSTSRC